MKGGERKGGDRKIRDEGDRKIMDVGDRKIVERKEGDGIGIGSE